MQHLSEPGLIPCYTQSDLIYEILHHTLSGVCMHHVLEVTPRLIRVYILGRDQTMKKMPHLDYHQISFLDRVVIIQEFDRKVFTINKGNGLFVDRDHLFLCFLPMHDHLIECPQIKPVIISELGVFWTQILNGLDSHHNGSPGL